MINPSFDFITQSKFRTSLENDYLELLECFEAEAWKAVHVLAGSIVEALLIQALIAEDVVKENKGLKLVLGEAIEKSREAGIVSERTSQLCAVIKNYRNLIHPGRAIRLEETIDANGAAVAKALVAMVVSDVEARRTDRYGYTAEQIVQKIESDSSAGTILSHLLKGTREEERTRLLLEHVPKAFLRAYEEWRSDDAAAINGGYLPPPDSLPTLTSCYRLCFDAAPEEVKQQAVAEYARIIREDSKTKLELYGNEFFRAEDLRWATPDDLALIKSHLLGRLENEAYLDFVEVLFGIGNYLGPSREEASRFVDPLVKLSLRENAKFRNRVGDLLESECANFAGVYPENMNEIEGRLEEWYTHLKKNGQSEKADVIASILNRWQTPF